MVYNVLTHKIHFAAVSYTRRVSTDVIKINFDDIRYESPVPDRRGNVRKGSEMLNNRQKKILEVVVREFIESGEPVASVTIAQKYDIGCCSATVRNDMARLEEMGYLEQPHTSSGRVPMDKAYRLFVDEIVAHKIAPPPESAAQTIETEYQLIQRHMERLLNSTARLLSRLTHYTAVLLAPQLAKSLFKYLKLVSLGPNSILLFVLTNTGSIIHRTIEVSKPLGPDDLERITNLLNDRIQGKSINRISQLLGGEVSREVSAELIEGIKEASSNLSGEGSREIILGGRTHLLDFFGLKDMNRIRVLMELLEDEKIVAEILSGTLQEDGIQVLIGEENPLDVMRECSMVTSTYTIDGEPVGTLGIIGPKRMPYESVIQIVNYIAENFSSKLQNLDQL